MRESQLPDRKAIVLLLMLVAGVVDAVGLAETGRYFVSFMSGNVTIAGLDLGTGGGTGALLPIGLTALFVAGAAAGALIAERAGRAAGAAVLIVEAGLLMLGWAGLGSARPMMGVVALPVAMGLANIVPMRAGATYATGTLVALGVAIADLGRPGAGREVGYRGALAAALLAGAALGAVGRLRHGGAVLLAPAAVLVLLGLVEAAAAARAKKAAARGR